MKFPDIVRALLALPQFNGDQKKLAKALGTTQATISRWQSARMEPRLGRGNKVRDLAMQLGIITDLRRDHTVVTVPISGFVGLGEAIEWCGDNMHLEHAELPFPVPAGCIGLECKGDSMSPRVKSGEIVVVLFSGERPDHFLNQEVVVHLVDGGYLLKTLRRGYEPGTFNLESYSAPLRENARVDQVGEVWAIIPSPRWRHLS